MLLQKIKSGQSGILLYGITPPKEGTPPERVTEIAGKTMSRLLGLDLDALIVYDVQDESARTAEVRPFPFISALDPFLFAKEELSSLPLPKIVYRPAGKYTSTELEAWLEGMNKEQFYPVFVGVPAPDYIPKTSLKEAYAIWKKFEKSSIIGAVMIPERHAALKDEPFRILDKTDSGVSFFISQCIFNVGYATQMMDDLIIACREQNRPVPTLIFTLTACGSHKTLQFLEWLGIHIPEDLKNDFLTCENVLEKSIEVCYKIADELIAYCTEKGVPFGFNVESVAIRKEEIEASVKMVQMVGEKLRSAGLRSIPTTRIISEE